MKLELSKEAIDIILAELEADDRDCDWELGCLPQHKTDAYIYWTQKQAQIRKALNELRRAIC